MYRGIASLVDDHWALLHISGRTCVVRYILRTTRRLSLVLDNHYCLIVDLLAFTFLLLLALFFLIAVAGLLGVAGLPHNTTSWPVPTVDPCIVFNLGLSHIHCCSCYFWSGARWHNNLASLVDLARTTARRLLATSRTRGH